MDIDVGLKTVLEKIGNKYGEKLNPKNFQFIPYDKANHEDESMSVREHFTYQAGY
jgi:hypothetical protein